MGSGNKSGSRTAVPAHNSAPIAALGAKLPISLLQNLRSRFPPLSSPNPLIKLRPPRGSGPRAEGAAIEPGPTPKARKFRSTKDESSKWQLLGITRGKSVAVSLHTAAAFGVQARCRPKSGEKARPPGQGVTNPGRMWLCPLLCNDLFNVDGQVSHLSCLKFFKSSAETSPTRSLSERMT